MTATESRPNLTSASSLHQNEKDSQHLPAVDGLRAISILLVLFAHNLGPITEPIGAYFSGAFGVDVFFIVSGFLITTLLLKEQDRKNGQFDLGKFYLRRVLRIAPAFYTFIVCAALWHCFRYNDHHLKPYLYAGLYLTNLDFAFKLNLIPVLLNINHLWSLALEEQFYLIWPATLKSMRKLSAATMLKILACFYVVKLVAFQIIVLENRELVRTLGLVFGMDFILYGIAAAFLVRIPAFTTAIKKVFTHPAAQISLAVVTLMAAHWLGISNSAAEAPLEFIAYWSIKTPVTLTLATLFVISAVLAPEAPVSKGLSCRALTFIGRLSYSLYIWHELAKEVFTSYNYAFIKQNPYCAEICQYALLALMGCSSYFLVEKPFLKLKAKLTR